MAYPRYDGWRRAPVVLETAPVALVSAANAKIWAQVLVADSDARVTALLSVAQASIERSEIGRAFGVQTLSITNCEFGCSSIDLPYPPLRSVNSIEYVDADGADQTLDAELYEVFGIGGRGGVRLKAGGTWPAVEAGANAVKITYEAGYDDTDPSLMPAKMATVLAATQLRSVSTQDLSLRSEEIDGVRTVQWTVSESAARIVSDAVSGLLGQYQVMR